MDTSTINIVAICITLIILAFMAILQKEMQAKRERDTPSFIERFVGKSKNETSSKSL